MDTPEEDRLYILYDSRAACPGSDTSEASILVVCEDDEDACSFKGDFGGMACYSYRKEGDNKLVDERFEWNWFPGMPE